ncbi:MAG: sensor histidine kinase [Acidimicrobiia bacterium]
MQEQERPRRTSAAPSDAALLDYLLEHGSDAVAVVDPSVDPPVIVAASVAHETMMGSQVGSVLGADAPPGLRRALRRIVDHVLEHGPLTTGGRWDEPTGRRDIHAVWRVLPDGRRRFVAGHAIDAAATASPADRLNLEVLLDAALVERRRYAQHLHDDAVQVLAAVAMELAWLERRAGDHADQVHTLRGAVEGLNGRLRSLITNLDPVGPAAEDLGTALADGLRTDAEAAGVVLVVEDRFAGPLPQPTAEALYWIATEAVHNAIAHSGAAEVTITIKADAGGVRLTVADAGCGFDPLAVAASGRYGLTSIRTRAHRAGGVAGTGSAPGRGTVMDAWLPLDANASRPAADAATVEVADAIRAFDADLRLLWSTTAMGIIAGNQDDVVIKASPATRTLIGDHPEGLAARDCLAAEPQLLAAIAAIRSGTEPVADGVLRTDAQRRFWVERLAVDGGPPWAWLVTITPPIGAVAPG